MKRLNFLLILIFIMTSCSSTQDEPTAVYPPTQIVEDIEAHNTIVFNDFFDEVLQKYSEKEDNTALDLLTCVGKYVDSCSGERIPLLESLVFSDRDVRYDPNSTYMVFTPRPTMVYNGMQISFKFNVGYYNQDYIVKINYCDGFYIRGTVKNINVGGNLTYHTALCDIDLNNNDFYIIPMGDPDIR